MVSSKASRPLPLSGWQAWVPLALVVLALLAPALGGATDPLIRAVLLIAAMAVVVIAPPTRRPGRWYLIGLGGLLGWAALALLPVGGFLQPEWRALFERDLGIPLGLIYSPQPASTQAGLIILAAGMLWFLLAVGTPLSVDARWAMLRGYVLGATVLAALALGAHATGWQPGLWNPAKGLGFFPNRNQMGNWLALASILVPALVYKDWRNRGLLALGWLLPLVLFAVTLVANGSRAGILLFFGGLLLWMVWYGLRRSERQRGGMTFFVGLAVIAVFATLFLLYGGKVLERMRSADEEAASGLTASMRWKINLDAAELTASSLPLGTGLGNFEPVFALYRERSASQDRALHPESDWAWLAVETGPVGLLLTWVLVGFALWRVFPLDHDTGRAGRLAAGVAALAFVIHGFLDVNGHRLGTVLPALLLLALAWHPRHLKEAETWYPLAVRGLAAVVAVLLVWVAVRAWRMQQWEAEAERGFAAGRGEPALAAYDALAAAEPLNWEWAFGRARARVVAGGSRREALRDFQRARVLEPLSPRVPRMEGKLWLAADPRQALAAFTESIRRAGSRAGEEFSFAMQVAKNDPSMRPIVARLALVSPEMTVRWAQTVQPEEFGDLRREVERRDPGLATFTPEERARWFGIWAKFEGPEAVAAAIAEHPEWEPDAGRVLATAAARAGRYQDAYLLLHGSLAKPVLPKVAGTGATDAQLRQQLIRRPDDYVAAFRLVRRRPGADSLSILRSITVNKNCPAYFYYMQAGAAAESGQWQEAWESLLQYEERRPAEGSR